MKKILLRLLISLAIAALFIWWFKNQGLNLIPSWQELTSTLAWWAVPVYLAVLAVFFTLRAWRWVYLLKPVAEVKKRRMLPVAFIGFLAILVMPLRTGELMRPYLINRRCGVSKSAAFGTIAIERVIDGLLVSLWLTICLFAVPASVSPYIWSLRIAPLALFVSALGVLLAFLWKKDLVKRFFSRVLGLFSVKLKDAVLGVLDRFWTGLQALPNRRYIFLFVVMSIAYWGLNGTGFWILARGCGLDLPFVGAIAGMTIVAVGIMLPSGPGFFGNFQVGTLLSLSFFLPQSQVRSSAATIFIFLIYVLQVGWALLFGLLSILIERIPVDKLLDTKDAEPDE